MWTITRSDGPRWRSLPIALVLFLLPAAARAQAPDPPDAAAAPSDPLDTLRGRFREGMEKYRARAFGDAIVIWESIYRELGAEKGYRVAFDLGRAYDEVGELIKAAEHYQTYLDRVASRRRDGESLEPNVQSQELIARDRLERIIHIYGGIHVSAAKHQVIVRVDNAPPRVAGFTVYVEPGEHVVTFGSGREADVRKVTVRRGELLEVEPREEASVPEVRYEVQVRHPFSPVVVWIAAGAAAASVLVPVITYANALSIKSDFESPSATPQAQQRLKTDYESARSNAYASVAIPAVLALSASGLAVWYLAGKRELRVPLPAITPTAAALSLTTRF